jgi:hypothetical protein
MRRSNQIELRGGMEIVVVWAGVLGVVSTFRLFLGRDGQLGADLGNGHKVYNLHYLSCRRNIHDRFLLGHHLIINSAPAPQPVNNRDGKEDIVSLLKAMAVIDVDKVRSRQLHIGRGPAHSSKPTAIPALVYNESAMC